jgi:hypothetical protein
LRALSDASLDWIDQAALRDLMRDKPDVSIRVLWEALEHERHLHNWVVGLGQAVAVERVGQMLLDFRHRLQRRGLSTGDTFHVPLSQQQMAEYLGINVVHLNRILRRLREAELVVIERQRWRSAIWKGCGELPARYRTCSSAAEREAPRKPAGVERAATPRHAMPGTERRSSTWRVFAPTRPAGGTLFRIHCFIAISVSRTTIVRAAHLDV